MTTASLHSDPGFTLIEVMAVVFLTAMVLGVTLDYYSDLSNASQRAMDRTREVRRATAILDRVAKDLQGAALVVKPGEMDRISHPWVFLGENRIVEKGSDRLKFVTRSYQPKRESADRHESDLAIVTYKIDENDEGALSLRRRVTPRLPEGLDRDFPEPDEMLLLTDELDSFSLTFLDEDGAWQDVWDSSQLVRADQLPIAVKIEVALADSLAFPDEPNADPDGGFGAEGAAPFSRIVVLPMRPLNLEKIFEGGFGLVAGDDSGDDSGNGNADRDSDCPTIAECFDQAAALADGPNGLTANQTWGNPTIANNCFEDQFSQYVQPACQ